MRSLNPYIPNTPRLVKCLKWQGVLTTNEAASAIIAHRQNDGQHGGSEAVVHYGGATKLLQDAIKNRKIIRYLNGGTLLDER